MKLVLHSVIIITIIIIIIIIYDINKIKQECPVIMGHFILTEEKRNDKNMQHIREKKKANKRWRKRDKECDNPIHQMFIVCIKQTMVD